MKQTRRMFSWLVAGSLALLMVTSVTAQTTKERVQRVVRLKGSARYSTGNNVWQPIKVGTLLHSGALIQTAAGSYVDLVLGEADLTPPRAVASDQLSYQSKAEQDTIRVSQDTVLAFEKMTVVNTGSDEVTETELDLRSGKIFGTVKKLGAGSHYEIKLPNGVAGIRGTTYSISADGVVQVLSGNVIISWVAPDGTPMTQTVSGGNQFDIRSGLLTPIPVNDGAEMLRASRRGTTTFSSDPYAPVNTHTILYIQDRTSKDFVSPTQGSNLLPPNPGTEPTAARGASDEGK